MCSRPRAHWYTRLNSRPFPVRRFAPCRSWICGAIYALRFSPHAHFRSRNSQQFLSLFLSHCCTLFYIFCSFPHPARASEGRTFGLRLSELWESGFLPFPPWVPFLPRSFVIGCLCVFFPSPTLCPPYLRPRSCLPRRSSGDLLIRTRRKPRSMAIPLHTLADVFLAAS